MFYPPWLRIVRRVEISPLLLAFLFSAAFWCNAEVVHGHIVEELIKTPPLSPLSSSAYDHFGASVAISGEFMAIGVPNHDSQWSDSGAVFLYRYAGEKWVQFKKLQARTPREGGLFGSSLAIDGSYLIVGEPGSQFNQRGYVHVFAKNHGGTNSWGWLRQLSRPDDCHLREDDTFGESVSLSGNTVVVGSPTACKSRADWIETTGAVYVFSSYGGLYHKKLLAHNGREGDRYGAAVAVCGSYVFVGAPEADSGSLRQSVGVAYVYDAGRGWALHRFLNPSFTLEDDGFGTSVACTGKFAAIGAPAESRSYGNDSRKGSVYLYNQKNTNSGWRYMSRLREENYFNEEPGRNNHFGESVAIDGSYLVVGFGESAKNDLDVEPMAVFFTFHDNTWKPIKILTRQTASSCTTSSYDRGFTAAFSNGTLALADMEDESDTIRCERGLAADVEVYQLGYRDVRPLPFLLLLRND